MSGLATRRLFVWLLSTVLGVATAFGIITLGFDLLPFISDIQQPQGVSLATYGYQYFFWTAFPLVMVFVIWLDAAFGTKILPE